MTNPWQASNEELFELKGAVNTEEKAQALSKKIRRPIIFSTDKYSFSRPLIGDLFNEKTTDQN